jgi:hypothetical protein
MTANTRVGRYKDSEDEIGLTRRGFRLATSTGGTLTGRGGALSDVKRNGVNAQAGHGDGRDQLQAQEIRGS